MFWIFFCLIAGCAVFQTGLDLLNWRWIRQHRGTIPPEFAGAVDPEKVAKIEAYTQAKIMLHLLGDVIGKSLMLMLLLIDGFAWFSVQVEGFGFSPLPTALIFFGALSVAGGFLSLPFDWYATFRLEERFGFNRTGYRLWIMDKIKSLVLGSLIGGLLLSVVILLLYHAGPLWWLICWSVVFGFSFLLNVLYPIVIAPLFNKFTPLEEGDFRGRVLELMDRAGIRSKEVMIMDAGKRSAHTNAYFTGIGRTKRIVFYDTLLEKHTEEQGLAVLAHEAGHWKKKHVLKNVILSQSVSLSLFAVTGWLVLWEPMYIAFGFGGVRPYAGLFLVSLVYSPAMFFLQPFLSIMSRRFEYEADRFAAHAMNLGQALCDMLVKLSLDNLSNLNPHPWYVWFHYSHPTVVQRIRRIKE
ncbi:MAG: M48 family metallopeptidase [Planctomycetota bacterium]